MRLILLLIIFIFIPYSFGQANLELSTEKKEQKVNKKEKEAKLDPKKIGFTYLRTQTYSCGGVTKTVKEYRHDKTGMEFVLILAGAFMMGSNNGDDDEKPVHRVTISMPFLMSKYEVTQKVWQKIMGNNPSYYKGDNLPVEKISWDDAMKFCKQTDLQLPSGAQWEYACRAGTQTKYYWGDSIDGNYAWYKFNSGSQSHEVGQKEPNAFGLYDMSGNVWEWCRGYKRTYSSATITDPADGSHSTIRVVRGGGWFYYFANNLRSANRYFKRRVNRNYDLGFRVIKPLK